MFDYKEDKQEVIFSGDVTTKDGLIAARKYEKYVKLRYLSDIARTK
jgi:hypothetical protein